MSKKQKILATATVVFALIGNVAMAQRVYLSIDGHVRGVEQATGAIAEATPPDNIQAVATCVPRPAAKAQPAPRIPADPTPAAAALCPAGQVPQPTAIAAPKGAPSLGVRDETIGSPPPSSQPILQNGAYYFYNTMYEYKTATSVAAQFTQGMPLVEQHGGVHSLIEMAAALNSTSLSTVELGWVVDPVLNQDAKPHLFIYHFVDGATTCYNGCGYVQMSATRFPGMTVSANAAPQDYAIEYLNGDWWVGYQGEWIGYFPATLWPEQYASAPLVEWYAEIASPDQLSCNQMGNGILGTQPGAALIQAEQVNGQTANALLDSPTYTGYRPGFVTGSSFSVGGPGVCPAPLVAGILPGSRSVQVGAKPTVFANILNTGQTALGNCSVALPPVAPSGLSLTYQSTDPATNSLTGTPNIPVSIPAAPVGGAAEKTFILTFNSATALTSVQQNLIFVCDGVFQAPPFPGVNTVDLLFSPTPVPDVIAIAGTLQNDGIVHVTLPNLGVFAVATTNIGAAGTIKASLDSGGTALPLKGAICQTNPVTAQCLSPATSSSVTVDFAANATPTFSIFVEADADIPFAPASSRIFVRFVDGNNVEHGATSVAVEAVSSGM